jgi:hypothetical protein
MPAFTPQEVIALPERHCPSLEQQPWHVPVEQPLPPACTVRSQADASESATKIKNKRFIVPPTPETTNVGNFNCATRSNV